MYNVKMLCYDNTKKKYYEDMFSCCFNTKEDAKNAAIQAAVQEVTELNLPDANGKLPKRVYSVSIDYATGNVRSEYRTKTAIYPLTQYFVVPAEYVYLSDLNTDISLENKGLECVDFRCTKDLSQYIDSMLFDSGTLIAEASFNTTNNKQSAKVELVVRGAVRVEADGNIYTSPSEFPDWLKERIQKNPNGWQYLDTDDKKVFYHDSNWFEFIVTPDGACSDGVMYEADLSKDTPEGIYQAMIEILHDYFKE